MIKARGSNEKRRPLIIKALTDYSCTERSSLPQGQGRLRRADGRHNNCHRPRRGTEKKIPLQRRMGDPRPLPVPLHGSVQGAMWTTCPNRERSKSLATGNEGQHHGENRTEVYGLCVTTSLTPRSPDLIGYCGSNPWYNVTKKFNRQI